MFIPTARAVTLALIATASIPALAAGQAEAACTLQTLAEIPVTMAGQRPLIPVTADDVPLVFLLDSGAFYSVMAPAAAAQMGLRLRFDRGFDVEGIGGGVLSQSVRLRRLTVGGRVFSDQAFVVVDGAGPGVAGAVGQNILNIADAEYDLANGAVRLLRPEGCGRDDGLAYWTKGPAAVLTVDPAARRAEPHTIALVEVNGKRLRALLDTGSAVSSLSLRAAAGLGITPASPGVRPAPGNSGVGPKVVQAWTTPIASLALGGEVIRNTRLGLTSGDLGDADMVLGVDFFLAHRIYVSRDQQRIYVTYNGGGVFRPGAEAAPAQVGDTQPDDAAAGADGLRRRGAALLARGQAAQAIEAFGRAIQLEPRAAGAYYDRAMAYSQQGQLDLSLADLDAGLALEPGDAAFLLARAAVYIVRDAQGDPALAKVDLDAAARHAAGHPVLELRLAELYEQADQFGEAVRRYGVWLAANPYDGQRAEALNGRCRALALQRKDLDQALKDCAAATRLRSGDPYFLETRALARLARSEFGPAIADAGAVLTLNPKAALARWVRGRAELGAGRTAEGRADLTAAADADPKAAARLERLGFAS